MYIVNLVTFCKMLCFLLRVYLHKNSIGELLVSVLIQYSMESYWSCVKYIVLVCAQYSRRFLIFSKRENFTKIAPSNSSLYKKGSRINHFEQ
jgi:hypothetical protein